MNIAICEDIPQELDLLRRHIETVSQKRGIETACTFFHQGGDLLRYLEQTDSKFTMAFLDVYMPGMSGVQTAQRLKEAAPATQVVFVTSSRDFAVDAFELDALHYLVKPVTEEQVAAVFDRYKKLELPRPSIRVRVGRDAVDLELSSIQYLESCNSGTDIHTPRGVLHTTVNTSKLAEQLNDSFLKIQRGLVVNLHYVQRMTTDSCVLKNGVSVLLSRKERSQIRTAYREFVFNAADGKETL